MQKRVFLTFLLLILLSFSAARAQNPLVKIWDKTFGGLEDDEPSCFQETSDGGFIIGGYTYSDIGGDKTNPLKNAAGIVDFWVVKIDSMGVKEWDRDLGGANGDQLNALQQTSDGGYILGGLSASNISGDKTAASWGNFDYWIIKLDSAGNILWDKDFGGSSSDQLTVIRQTSDGGFILGGSSVSDSSGNKSQHGRGAQDYWIVKTDAFGNQQWDKTFGGSGVDKLYSIAQTTDGGYILGGASWSPADGERSDSSWGAEDFWIIKIDSLGNKKWDRDFGGTEGDALYDVLQTRDGGYIAGGRSGSGISGNKTQPSWGGFDFWLVRLDSAGNFKWDKSLGGSGNEDEFGNVSFTDDGGFIISGTSYSPISGDKTENNLGQEQSWFVKMDSLFNKEWDKTVFTACHDEIGLTLQTKGQCYAVVNTNGPSCGAGGYRSAASWNNGRDFWIVKFCDSTYYYPLAATGAAQRLCPGTCTSFLNLSERSTSWQWSFPGAHPDTSSDQNPANICYTSPGSYDVVLVASNLHGSDTLTLNNYVTVNPYPAPQGILQSADTLFANPGAVAYQWYHNGTMISGATDYFLITLVDGDFNVTATDSNGCEVEAAIFGVVTDVSLENKGPGQSERISVYPNPVTDKFSIHKIIIQSGDFADISVYNLVGENIFNRKFVKPDNRGNWDIDCTGFPEGIYFVQVTDGSGSSRAQFVKVKSR